MLCVEVVYFIFQNVGSPYGSNANNVYVYMGLTRFMH